MPYLAFRTSSGRAPALRGGASVLLPIIALLATSAAASATDLARVATFTTPEGESFNRPFYAGVFLGDGESRAERIGGSIERFSQMVGKRPALVKAFHALDADFSARGWSGQQVRAITRVGSTPYIALDLRWPGAPRAGLLDAIIAGRADAALVRAARGLASAGTVLVEPGWEMNGRWDYAWQGAYNGDASGPAKYRQAFQHVVNVFRREGAGNVKWVFAPNVGNPLASGAGARHWNHYANYYPGDRYVDILGPHGYNGPSVWGSAYAGFETVFDGAGADRMLSDLERRYPNKPIIIGEFATQEARGFDKGRWVQDAFAVMRRHRNVIGAIWFNMNKEADWRIDSSRSSLEAYRAVMRDPNIRTAYRG